MFRKALLLVLGVTSLVSALGFSIQWVSLRQMPSTYDTGLRLEQAFRQAKTPILVEFYADRCLTCRRVTPLIHEVMPRYAQQLTWVMVDVDDPQNAPFASLFGVKALPSVYVFDPRRMKKHVISLEDTQSAQHLEAALQRVVAGRAPA